MRVKILTYGAQNAVAPLLSDQGSGLFWNFVPGVNDGGFLDQSADEHPGLLLCRELQSQFFAWKRLLSDYDYIGFETSARRFFIDPLPPRRLEVEFPDVAAARLALHEGWNEVVLKQPAACVDSYERMRRSFSVADEARIFRWLGRLDLVVPPRADAARYDKCKSYLTQKWLPFANVARKVGVFRMIPDGMMNVPFRTCRWNSYVIRTHLFAPFISDFFEAMSAYSHVAPFALTKNVRFFSECLFSAYISYLLLENPLLRVAELPLLGEALVQAPETLPLDFDEESYLALNPDVAEVKFSPIEHYLSFGWREGREWIPA